MPITNIVPVVHEKLGSGFIITEETFLTLKQFQALISSYIPQTEEGISSTDTLDQDNFSPSDHVATTGQEDSREMR